MKKLILIFLLFGLVAGCSKKEEVKKVESNNSSKDISISKTIAEGSGETSPNEISDKVTDIELDAKDIPKSVQYNGKIVASAKWMDKNGINYIIITETKEKTKKLSEAERDKGMYIGESLSSKELFGYQYIINNETSEEVWKIQDFEKGCDADLTLEFIKKSLSITDLNNNGIAESTFLYRQGCMSDVSPLGYKLMMHEGKEKFAIRGTQKVVYEGVDPYGGETNIDKSFDSAPEGFLDYAKKEWKKFQKQF
jgi:hypothetical protein